MNVSKDISTLFVKCPILSKRASFLKPIFSPQKSCPFPPHKKKTTKRFSREKTCRSRCAQTHSSLPLCFYILLIFSAFRAIRCARRMVDWTVASFLRRRMDLDFFNFAREIRVSCERENCASLRFESRKSGRKVHARGFECALGCFVARSKESFVRGVCFRTGWLDVREGFRTIARVYARLCDRMGFFRSR